MIINGDYDDIKAQFYIAVVPNKIKLTCIVHITNPNYKVDFTVPKSFATLLGFTKSIVNYGYNESTNILDYKFMTIS